MCDLGNFFLKLFFSTVKALSREKQREATRFSINTVTNILISFFSEVTSVQHDFKIIRGNYVSVQCTTLTIWGEQAAQGKVEAVEPEKVVEEEEDGIKRRILTQIRRIPQAKNSYSPYYKALSMSGCLHMKLP